MWSFFLQYRAMTQQSAINIAISNENSSWTSRETRRISQGELAGGRKGIDICGGGELLYPCKHCDPTFFKEAPVYSAGVSSCRDGTATAASGLERPAPLTENELQQPATSNRHAFQARLPGERWSSRFGKSKYGLSRPHNPPRAVPLPKATEQAMLQTTQPRAQWHSESQRPQRKNRNRSATSHCLAHCCTVAPQWETQYRNGNGFSLKKQGGDPVFSGCFDCLEKKSFG